MMLAHCQVHLFHKNDQYFQFGVCSEVKRMELITCPFSLGTSTANPDDIIPVDVANLNSSICNIKLKINGIKYENVSSDSKDRSFVTVVYNKITKKVEIFSRPPEFLAPVFDVETIDEPPDQLPVNRVDLTFAFGSAKRQKLLKEYDRNLDRNKAVADAAVLQRAASGQSELRAEAKAAASADQKPTDLANFTTERSQRKQLLPPYSITAKAPVEAYPLQEFAPPSCFSALREEAMRLAGADAATCQKWLADSTYPHFILDRLNYLPVDEKNSASSANSTARKRSRKDAGGATRSRLDVATSLALLSHMFHLFKLRPRDLQQKQPLARTPPPVARHLLNEFTIMMAREGLERVKVRTMTPTLRDKLLYHIVVLLLHCDDFTTTIDDLTVDFKLPSDRLKKYFVFVGCRLSKQDPSKDADSSDKSALEASSRPKTIARLMTPLVFKDAKPLAYKR